jgi:hypothetical protein
MSIKPVKSSWTIPLSSHPPHRPGTLINTGSTNKMHKKCDSLLTITSIQAKTDFTMKLTNEPTPITDAKAKHSYAIEYAPGQSVRVDANTRAQAASRAKKAGLTVRSVNMLG